MDTSRSPLEATGFSRKLAATIIIVYMIVTPYTDHMDGCHKL